MFVCILLGFALYGGVGAPGTQPCAEEWKGWVSRHPTPNLAPRLPDNFKLEESENVPEAGLPDLPRPADKLPAFTFTTPITSSERDPAFN